MSGVYFDREGVTLKKYTSTTTSGPRGKSVVRIELETTDPYALASLLHQLDGVDAEQRAAAAAAKRTPKPLALPYYGGSQ